MECQQHGVVTVKLPWAEPRSGFTALIEALVDEWLKAAAVLKQRAARLSRPEAMAPKRLSIDEIPYRKGHDYITGVTDQESGSVLHVAKGIVTASLGRMNEQLCGDQLNVIEAVCMDMWWTYIKATRAAIADADHKIASDRFHVAQY